MSRLPKKFRVFVFKARWHSTSVILKIVAKDWTDGFDKATRMARKRDGGDLLIDIIPVEERDI